MPNAVVQETWQVRAIFSHALQWQGAWFPRHAMRLLMPLTCANDQVVPELSNLLCEQAGAHDGAGYKRSPAMRYGTTVVSARPRAADPSSCPRMMSFAFS